MKKLLFINNYSGDSEHLPKHHLWGLDALKNAFDVKVFIFRYSPILFRTLLTQFRVLLRSLFVDVVYAACGVATDGLALCKKLKLCRPKIFRVVHHPFKIRFIESYDGLIFISQEVMNIAIQRYPHMKNKMHYVFWGPDLDFYDNEIKRTSKNHLRHAELVSASPAYNALNTEIAGQARNDGVVENNISQNKEVSTYFFISNGKTRRDYDCFFEAMQGLDAKALVICDKDSVPKQKNQNIDVISSEQSYVNAISDKDSVREYLNAEVVVIPVKTPDARLIGLTSLVDALAMGMPAIMSDNTMTGIDIEQEQIGLLYKAGNSNDLRKQMQKMLNSPLWIKEMSQNARAFAEKNDYKMFKNSVVQIIKK